MTRRAEGKEGPAFIGDMTEEKSVELASKIASEAFVFGVRVPAGRRWAHCLCLPSTIATERKRLQSRGERRRSGARFGEARARSAR